MEMVVPQFSAINDWIISLHQNEVALLVALLGGALTIIAAVVGIAAAFRQIRIQFEHKVIYEAWRDFQTKLFAFSSSLNDYGAKVAFLTFIIHNQNYSLVSFDRSKYIFEQSSELTAVYHEMRKAYIDFLVSFENNEVIFLKLSKMNSLFADEMRRITEEKYWELSRAIFPESYGLKRYLPDVELEKMINQHNNDISKLVVYLQDMRIELQNETIGAILEKEVPKRPSNKGLKVLTRKGWKVQTTQPRKDN